MKRMGQILIGGVFSIAVAAASATSLYSEDTYQSLVSDQRSNQVGQSLTVLIYEEASSSTSASTDTNRSSAFNASSSDNVKDNAVGIELEADTEGGGTINRNGKLIASVTVTITEKLEHGALAILGEQLIEFNEEKQHIRLSGRVRPEDISARNTVLSTRIADAKITYVGDGLLGRRQQEGVLSRFFNWLF